MSGRQELFPLSCLLEFADLPFDHVALQSAEVRKKKNAIQVIDFVLQSTRIEIFTFYFDYFSQNVVSTYTYAFCATHILTKARDTQTAFLPGLFAFLVENLRVDE